jgi:hypothetical protein
LHVLQIGTQPAVDAEYRSFLEVNVRHQVSQASDDRTHSECEHLVVHKLIVLFHSIPADYSSAGSTTGVRCGGPGGAGPGGLRFRGKSLPYGRGSDRSGVAPVSKRSQARAMFRSAYGVTIAAGSGATTIVSPLKSASLWHRRPAYLRLRYSRMLSGAQMQNQPATACTASVQMPSKNRHASE